MTPRTDADAMRTNAGDVKSLVLRAWLEAGSCPSLRIRVVEVDLRHDDRSVIVTASVDEACQSVRDWLEILLAGHASDAGGAVTPR